PDQTGGASVEVDARPRPPQLLRRRDDDDGVEQLLCARLVQQRDLDDRDVSVDALQPGPELTPHVRMEQAFEPSELVGVLEYDLRDSTPIGRAEALLERGAHVRVRRDQSMDD